MTDFVHLHLHSEYSTLDGMNRLDNLPQHIKAMGQTACALTDHGNMAGSYTFWKNCKKEGIKPILGFEAYYAADRLKREDDELGEHYYHMVLLAENNVGLHNLFHLTSEASTTGLYYKPRLDDTLLDKYREGVMATSACLGSRTSQLILHDRKAEAEALLQHHAEIFKDRFFVELQTHHGEQQVVNKALIEMADRLQLPLICTGDCHYTLHSDRDLHEMTLCMQTKKLVSDTNRMTLADIDLHVSSGETMAKWARECGIPDEALQNTVAIGNAISNDYFSDLKNRFPTYKETPPDQNSWDHLDEMVQDGLIMRFKDPEHVPDAYIVRAQEELRVIKRMGFSDYMLIVYQFCAKAKELGVYVGPGRGSAGGSLVAWALNITQLDPIKYDLLFSRFLNEGRSGSPMIFDDTIKDQLAHI